MSAGSFATARRGFDMSDVEFILQKRREGIPDGALARMMGRSQSDVQTVAKAVAPPVPARERPYFSPGMEAIARRVSLRHGLKMADLMGQSRKHAIAHVRQEAMSECREAGNWSYPQIGAFFGGRDHTTIIHGVRQHAKRLEAAEQARAA